MLAALLCNLSTESPPVGNSRVEDEFRRKIVEEYLWEPLETSVGRELADLVDAEIEAARQRTAPSEVVQFAQVPQVQPVVEAPKEETYDPTALLLILAASEI